MPKSFEYQCFDVLCLDTGSCACIFVLLPFPCATSRQKTTCGVPVVVQQKQIWLVTMRLQVQSLVLLSGSRIQRCHELWCRSQTQLGPCCCGIGCSCSSDWTPKRQKETQNPKKTKQNKKQTKNQTKTTKYCIKTQKYWKFCFSIGWCILS